MLLIDVLLSVDGTINMLSHVMLLTDVLLSVDGTINMLSHMLCC